MRLCNRCWWRMYACPIFLALTAIYVAVSVPLYVAGVVTRSAPLGVASECMSYASLVSLGASRIALWWLRRYVDRLDAEVAR